MTLVHDDRDNLAQQGKAGLHALIAGVSAYRHLPGGAGRQASEAFGMGQLTSTAITAYKTYRWLLDNQSKLPLPLATIRLLLSPSPAEIAKEPALNGLAEPCTLDNFLTAAADWRDDANTNKENVTLFYFAGHGIQRGKDDSVLLLEDFNGRGGDHLRNSVETANLFFGMAPPNNSREKMARTQFYFIDACRNLPEKFKNFEEMTPTPVFSRELSGRDDRISAPIFFAAISDTAAHALPGDQTLFSKALFQCLEGGAGRPVEDENGQVNWHISVFSLGEALQVYLDDYNAEFGSDQEWGAGGQMKQTTICHLDKVPDVEIILEVNPIAALDSARLQVVDSFGNPVAGAIPKLLAPHPFRLKLPANVSYRLTCTIDPPNPLWPGYEGTLVQVLPPRKRRVLKVVP